MLRHLLVTSLFVVLLLGTGVVVDALDPSEPGGSPPAGPSGVAGVSEPTSPARTPATVHSVLFFSPTCGHCHLVISETLPPLFAAHGGAPSVRAREEASSGSVAFYRMTNGTLDMLLVDVTQPHGQAMFVADNARLGLDAAGVPRLDIADRWLVGSEEIPDVLPGLIEAGLAGEGVEWPAIPGLEEALAGWEEDARPAGTAAPAEPASSAPAASAAGVLGAGPGSDDGPLELAARDPVGNGLAVLVLGSLAVTLVAAPLLAVRRSLPASRTWLVPLLALGGFLVAVYLAAVETDTAAAVCGPIGDCRAVQESDYARLLGVPIGLLGAVAYATVGTLWLVAQAARGALADIARILIGLAALAGTLFSMYLTFLEPFVIGATCLWCITSAVTMMLLLWVTAGPAMEAWRRWTGGPGRGATART